MSSENELKILRRVSRQRITGLLLGFGILIWLPIEDQSELLVLIISTAICAWLAARFLNSQFRSDKQLVFRHALVGLAAGLALAPLAILLMAVKSGIHGHGTPDFSVEHMLSVLEGTFYFALSGILISLGIGVWRIARGQEMKEAG